MSHGYVSEDIVSEEHAAEVNVSEGKDPTRVPQSLAVIRDNSDEVMLLSDASNPSDCCRESVEFDSMLDDMVTSVRDDMSRDDSSDSNSGAELSQVVRDNVGFPEVRVEHIVVEDCGLGRGLICA